MGASSATTIAEPRIGADVVGIDGKKRSAGVVVIRADAHLQSLVTL